MEENKLKEILKIISRESQENEFEENIKFLLKSIIGENAISVKDLWFEKEKIKKDVSYHNIIISMIDILLYYLKDAKKANFDNYVNYQKKRLKSQKKANTQKFINKLENYFIRLI